jgi:hypothetical protein
MDNAAAEHPAAGASTAATVVIFDFSIQGLF